MVQPTADLPWTSNFKPVSRAWQLVLCTGFALIAPWFLSHRLDGNTSEMLMETVSCCWESYSFDIRRTPSEAGHSERRTPVAPRFYGLRPTASSFGLSAI